MYNKYHLKIQPFFKAMYIVELNAIHHPNGISRTYISLVIV